MARQHWLIKSEPDKYPFDKLVQDGQTAWDGVRNFEARNNLRAMKLGDTCLFYHSNKGKAVVGVAKVVRAAYPDPSTTGDFSAVDIAPVRPLARAVTLDAMRDDALLGKMIMFRKPRLSVVPISADEFDRVVGLGTGGKASAVVRKRGV